MKKYIAEGRTTHDGKLIVQELNIGDTLDERLVVSSHGRIFHECTLSDSAEGARDVFLKKELLSLQELEQKAKIAREKYELAKTQAPLVELERVWIKERF